MNSTWRLTLTLAFLASLVIQLPACKKNEPPAAAPSTHAPPAKVQPSPAGTSQVTPSQATPTPPTSAPASNAAPTGVVPTTAPAPATQANTTPEPNLPANSSRLTPPTDPTVASFMGLAAPKPATWIWHPPQNQLIVAEYVVPGRDGFDQARISVIPAGGSLESNIQRWQGQFKPHGAADNSEPVQPTVSELQVNGLNVTIVEMSGDYRGMGMTNYAQDTLFLTAIIKQPQTDIFVRFVGPRGTVEPNREAFMSMIKGLHVTEPQK